MQVKQISAVQAGEKYDVWLYALSEEGNIYVFRAKLSNPEVGEWKRVSFNESKLK